MLSRDYSWSFTMRLDHDKFLIHRVLFGAVALIVFSLYVRCAVDNVVNKMLKLLKDTSYLDVLNRNWNRFIPKMQIYLFTK